MSLRYTTVTQSILCLIILMYAATMYHLNYSGQKSPPKKKQQTNKQTKQKQNKKQFAVCESDIPETLKYSQGHQILYELVDQKQGFSHESLTSLKHCLPKKLMLNFQSNQKVHVSFQQFRKHVNLSLIHI